MKPGYGVAITDSRRPRIPFDADLESLDWQELDQLERQAAELLARIREQEDRRVGWKTSGSIVRGAPWPNDHGAIPWREWIDHPYKLLVGGTQIFVSEPYHLTNESLPELAALAESGWDIAITGRQARWFPGSTIAIGFSRRRGSLSAVPGAVTMEGPA